MSDLHEANLVQRPPEKAGLWSHLYSDYTVAAVIVVFTGVVYYLSTFIRKIPDMLAQGMQPTSYPRGILVFILAATIYMLIESRKTPLERPEAVPRLAYITIAAMFVSLVLSTWIDFFVGIVFFVVVCLPCWGFKRPVAVVVYGVTLAAVLYLMFGTFLRVMFPRGLLSNLLS